MPSGIYKQKKNQKKIKFCSACGIENKSMYKDLCGKCYRKKYRKENLEKLRLRSIRWQKNNPEKANKWRKNNPTKVKEAFRKFIL